MAFIALCCTAVVHSPVLALVYLIPLAAALYVARTATVVDQPGLHARALFGSRTLSAGTSWPACGWTAPERCTPWTGPAASCGCPACAAPGWMR